MGGGSVIPQPLMPRIPRGPARFPAPATGQPRVWGPPPQAGASRTRGPRAGTAPCPLPVAGCHCGPIVHPVPDTGTGVGARCFTLPRPRGVELQCCRYMRVPGGCPPQGDTRPSRIPVLEGCSSQGCLSWGCAHPSGILIPGKTHPRGMPTAAGHLPAPPLPRPCSGCSQTPRTGVGPPVGLVAGPGPPGPGPSNLGALPSPPPPPEPRGAVSPGPSGDGRCSFPVCRLVPPVAAPNARPRRHQPCRPGKFQRRGCRSSPGAMVMGAPAMGMDAPAGRGGRDGWAGDGQDRRKKGVCGRG